MRTRRAQRRVIASSGIASIVAGLLLATLGPVLAPAGAEPAPKVTICHATSATDGPYVEISVNQHAVNGGGNEDHTVHAGPVFDFSNPSANQGWGDIVPPFGTFGGLNWSSAGQAVHGNGCTAAAPAPDVCVYDAGLGADDVGCVPPVEPCVYDAGLGADDVGCVPPVEPCATRGWVRMTWGVCRRWSRVRMTRGWVRMTWGVCRRWSRVRTTRGWVRMTWGVCRRWSRVRMTRGWCG